MIDFAKLREPFPASDIEWRLQECGEKNGKIWAMCLAYITNRAIMQRLDDVCQPENWKNQYQPGPHGGIVCGLSIRCADEWVTKWDGADNTAVEAVKGGLSDAMKRAAVQWGIGRYLYNLESGFATIAENGEYRGKTKDGKHFKWHAPKLPVWALPTGVHTQAPTASTVQHQQTATGPDAEYIERVKVALKAMYGDDKQSALDKVEVLTSFVPKGKEEKDRVSGVRDFTTLKGKRLEILTHSLERLVPKKDDLPSICDFCGVRDGNHLEGCKIQEGLWS